MSEIPAGESWEYEPKWDGFRCLAFRDGKNVELQSKSGQPLARYFPEVVEALLKLKASKFVLDGELVIPAGSAGIAGSPAGQPRRGAMLPASRRQALGSSFDDLLQRIHPAASRVAKLAKETPAHFIVFDLLGDETGHRLLMKAPFASLCGAERSRACCLLASIVFAVPKVTQENASEDILQRKVPGNELEFHRTTDVFYASLGRTRLPGGMVRLVDCEQDTLMQSWKPLDSPLSQVLDTMVATDPRYRWQMQDGVVNLLPATGEPALLKTRLNEFDLEDIASAREALARLLALPEVKKGMRDLHLKPGY